MTNDGEQVVDPVTGPPVLVARELTKLYRRGPEVVHALRDVSFELLPGEVVALMGPSGSGKTTLLNVLCGWERPDTGTLLWHGAPIDSPVDLPWNEMAIVPQDVALIEEFSIAENIELPLRLAGTLSEDGPRPSLALIEAFGLHELSSRPPFEASLGEQQRAAIARALIARPRLLLADEPTAHQDELWVKGVLTMLRAAAAEGTTSLLATHSEEVLEHVNRLLTIQDGVLRESELSSR
ncbi:MAG: ABC transporter ATP-binding protein [Actinomycetota bacterium]|nr:ABC transporter ATP-binding protein [Actinomycetota bacterium]